MPLIFGLEGMADQHLVKEIDKLVDSMEIFLGEWNDAKLLSNHMHPNIINSSNKYNVNT